MVKIVDCGIYVIVNKNTGKFYLGSSHKVTIRLRNHKNKLEKDTHTNVKLKNSWKKHGIWNT